MFEPLYSPLDIFSIFLMPNYILTTAFGFQLCSQSLAFENCYLLRCFYLIVCVKINANIRSCAVASLYVLHALMEDEEWKIVLPCSLRNKKGQLAIEAIFIGNLFVLY